MKKRLLYLLPIMAMVLAGCGKDKNKTNEPEQQQSSDDQGGEQGGEKGGEQAPKKDFTGLSFCPFLRLKYCRMA